MMRVQFEGTTVVCRCTFKVAGLLHQHTLHKVGQDQLRISRECSAELPAGANRVPVEVQGAGIAGSRPDIVRLDVQSSGGEAAPP